MMYESSCEFAMPNRLAHVTVLSVVISKRRIFRLCPGVCHVRGQVEIRHSDGMALRRTMGARNVRATGIFAMLQSTFRSCLCHT